jgi:hypothetical protein
VLDVARNFDPVVLAIFPNGESRFEEIGVVERAGGDGHQTVELAFDPEMDG